METRQVEYFVAVAEELSFSRGARRVYAAQSTVSAGVRVLEAEVGTPLFERTSRAVALTQAGAAFLPEARELLACVARARTAASEAAAGLRGEVRIGTISQLGFVDLAAALGAFGRRHPGVDLRVTTSPAGSAGLADDLRAGRLDVALVGLPPAELPGLDAGLVGRVPFTVLVPGAHRLARRRGVTLADLADEPFVDAPPGFGDRTTLDQAFRAVGLDRRLVVEVPDVPAIARYVAAGLGVAVVPEVPDDARPVGVRPVRLTAPRLWWSLSLAVRPRAVQPPALAAVLRALREHSRPVPGA